ncbi:MAG: cofactor-independent phosphoglycerate mutase [Oscillospiraceae bacterium]|jgi:2,3-bisphosphoglycerate-independent phosphoglycerate mutase|nr:cofactor-independent phosphoglycerate mutase [Oscillospiraceae bacterium]
MKYLVLLCDGMGDYKNPQLDNKTPLEYAYTPNFDKLAKKSVVGTVQTVELDMKPGSDVANLAILGYDPKRYYTGRSPLEAGSIGIDMLSTDVSLRANLVTIENGIMKDYSGGDISTADAEVLIEKLKKEIDNEEFTLYSGVAYRHCLIWNNGICENLNLTPPHDITDREIAEYMPKNKKLLDITLKSQEILKGEKANSLWLWGEGKKAELDDFTEKFGLKGSMISAVDLLKGIGKFANMSVVNVENATGYIDTNFTGKANAAIAEFEKGQDLVYIHIEAPDECGHRGEILNKVKSLELIDKLVLEPILEYFSDKECKILITPDHATPLPLKTHTHDPVPFLIYNSTKEYNGVEIFNEDTANSTGLFIQPGYEIMKKFIEEY